MTETTIKKLEPKRIREFIGGGDLVKIEVLDQIEFQDTDECAWKEGRRRYLEMSSHRRKEM